MADFGRGWLQYASHTRGMGKGEKLLLYRMLARLDKKAVLGRLLLVPHFGCWKDPLLLQ